MLLAEMSSLANREQPSLADPCIPRHEAKQGNAAERSRAYGPSQGRFIDYGGGKLILADMVGGSWPAEKVRVKQGSFGFSVEGLQKAPRPWLFAGDEVLIEGDWYLIHFLHGDTRHPVVDGGVGSLKPADIAFFHPNPIGQDPNPIRLRTAVIDPATGAVTGSLEIRALDGGNSLAIVVGGPSFGTGVRLVLDFDAGTISAGMGLETHQVGFGEVLVQAIADLAADIMAVNAALPTLTPVVPAVLKATQLLVDTAASLSAGPPMLSTIVKVQ